MPRALKSAYALSVSLALLLVFAIGWVLPCASYAQTSVVGASTSTSSTTEGARKSFIDNATNTHWVFWYNGTEVEYASSPDGSTWTSRGTLAYNTPNFSVAYKVIGETSYIFFVTEANTYDVVLRRGTISGTSVSFDSEATVLDGTSANDAYIRPHVALDLNGKVWTAAFKNLGNVGDRYHLTARRTTNRGDQALSFAVANGMGKPAAVVSTIAMVPTSGDKMLAAVSGESDKNVVTYAFDGSTWRVAGSGGDYGTQTFASAWSGGTGTDYSVKAVAVDTHGNLYVGGEFATAGGEPASFVARWNGVSWSALGSGVNGVVYALALDSSGNLYVGGNFTTAGGITVNRIAKWDGTSWSALGSGVSGSVRALKFDASGNLYVGGYFTTADGVTVNRIAKWNGTSWSALGAGVGSTGVGALAFDASGNLYVGGHFTTAGGISANRIAKWNGTSWSALGAGISPGGSGGISVNALAFDASGNLYAGGSFYSAGAVTANHIAKWNGSTWSALGSGMGMSVNALLVDASGNVYAGGWFFSTGSGVPVSRIAKWNGSSWAALAEEVENVVFALTADAAGTIFAGGFFGTAGKKICNNIASFNGTSWRSYGTGFDGDVHAVAADASGNLYVGGDFTTIGGGTANFIARWDGISWSSLSTGMNGKVSTLIVDASGNLIAGGDFTSAGGVTVNRVAQWNGTSWSALGSGMNSSIYSLGIDGSGNVYAGGAFTTAGGSAANRIAMWNGSGWSALGSGVDDSVSAITIDASGTLYAGGNFITAGGVTVNRVAKWNGSSWSSLSTGMNGSVKALKLGMSGELYAGGSFTTAGGATANRIAKWDGSSWGAMSTGMNGDVLALTVDAVGAVYAGGWFSTAGGVANYGIARWDGSSWSAYGYSQYGTTNALIFDGLGILYVGGAWSLALIQQTAVSNQRYGTRVSLVVGESGAAHLLYIDGSRSVRMKTYSGSPGTWSASTLVATGPVTSQAAGLYGTNSALVSWFIQGGTVKYTEANAPYSVWSAPTSVSSTGTPTGISVHASSGTHSQTLATWNAVGGSPGEVVASLSGIAPTATPTVTPTFTATFTVTATPTPTVTPTFTPTLPAPPPPDIDFGKPGESPNGLNVVVRGRNVVVSGTGTVGYAVEVQVDGIVVGSVPITSSSGGATGAWTFTLPSLAPGEREITTVTVASETNRSAPSTSVKVVIVAPAPLDFTGVGDTAITAWRRVGKDIRFKTRRASSMAWTTQTMSGRYPAISDYDDDGVSDIAAVGVRDGSLEWNVMLSTTSERVKASVGAVGDTIVSGCNLAANKGASFAVFKSETRELKFMTVGDSRPRQVLLRGLGSCNVIGCGDTDGDGVDELLFTTRGADNRVRVVGYDTTGQRRFESKYNSFVRGFVVDRPNSAVPLVAVIGGTERRGRQVKITTMAGSFAFPRFFVERGATIGNGTFTTDTNQQVSGIFWANRKNRMVSRRLLARGEKTTELFKLPKGYSLVRPQGVVRTEGGR